MTPKLTSQQTIISISMEGNGVFPCFLCSGPPSGSIPSLMALGVIAMLLHECGHLLASLALGVRVKNVGMKWNKGFYIVRERGTVYQNLFIALAGPFVNVLLIGAAPWPSSFALANLCYALANILPIEGSDGSRIASCLRQIWSGEATT